MLGFRFWKLEGYRLHSVTAAAHWTIGLNVAECLLLGSPVASARHEAPSPDCACGLYSFHDPPDTVLADHVSGAVLAWGRIEVHGGGFRAQYAEPVVLAYDPQQPYELVDHAAAIASEMEIPFVRVDELAARASEYGSPIAAELRPEPRRPGGYARGGYISISPPPPLAPTRKDRAPLYVNALAVAANLAIGAALGSWANYGAAVGSAIAFVISWRSYRRRFRRG